jgi:hypothetical protein
MGRGAWRGAPTPFHVVSVPERVGAARVPRTGTPQPAHGSRPRARRHR